MIRLIYNQAAFVPRRTPMEGTTEPFPLTAGHRRLRPRERRMVFVLTGLAVLVAAAIAMLVMVLVRPSSGRTAITSQPMVAQATHPGYQGQPVGTDKQCLAKAEATAHSRGRWPVFNGDGCSVAECDPRTPGCQRISGTESSDCCPLSHRGKDPWGFNTVAVAPATHR